MLVAASVASYARAVTTNDKNCTSLSSVSSMETRMRWANATIPERVMVSKHHGREALGLGRSASCCMRQTHHAVQILENEYRNRFLGTVGNRPIVKPRADLRIAAVIQFFRHPQNIEAIVEPLLHSGLLHELVVNVDDQDECSQLLWRQRLGARPGDMVLLSNNVHELRAYNRGISLTDSELVVLLQDDDIPPLIHDWLVSATTLFAAIPKLAVLSGYAGWIARNSKASGAQTRLEFGDLQTYNGDITWPLPYEVDSVPFMPVTCSYLSPLFLRRSFLDTHYKRFDENLSLPGEPGILLDCDVSYAAWANDWVTGVYPAPFARGIGGHGTWLGENAAARQKRRIKNRRYLTAKYDLANLTRRAVGATKGLSLRRKQGPGSLPGSCWPVLQKRLYADWHIMETWAGATDTRHDECQSPKATIVASESECPAGSIASITGVAACCPARCGRCGGKNCDQLADGPQSCCAAYIQKVGRACNGTNPPCIPGQHGGEKPPLLLATGLSLATEATKTRASAPAIPVPAACPDTSVCPPQPRTVLAIEGGDPGAAFATLYYLYVVNGVQYAWHKGYVPYIVFNATWMQQTMGTAAADAPPLWEHFFRSYCPGVGPWLARCSNVIVVRPPQDWWGNHVHEEFKWSVKAWYCGSHERRRCRHEGWCGSYREQLYRSWRSTGSTVVSRTHLPNPAVAAAVDEAWESTMGDCAASESLAVHLRGSDKAARRRFIGIEEWEPFVASFFDGHRRGCVFVATDYVPFSAVVQSRWAQRWGAARVRMRTISTRSADKLGNFAGPHASTRDQKLRVALDVLVDLSLMARCQYFLHGASAVAEAAHYTNPALHRRSVDLEYAEDARALLNGSGGRLPWL
jgi:hypothetical protein